MREKYYFIGRGLSGLKAKQITDFSFDEERLMVAGSDLPSPYEYKPEPKKSLLPLWMMKGDSHPKIVKSSGLVKQVYELGELEDISRLIDRDTYLDKQQQNTMRKMLPIFTAESSTVSNEIPEDLTVSDERLRDIRYVFLQVTSRDGVKWSAVDRAILYLDEDQLELLRFVLDMIKDPWAINNQQTYAELPEYDETLKRIRKMVKRREKKVVKDGERYSEDKVLSNAMLFHHMQKLGYAGDRSKIRSARKLRAHYQQHKKVGPGEVEPFQETISSAILDVNDDVRGDMAAVAGILRLHTCIPPLADRLLGDRNPDVRVECAKSLGRIADARTIQPLVSGLEDGEGEVVLQCKKALAKKSTPGELQAIAQIGLKRESPKVRERVSVILEYLMDKLGGMAEFSDARNLVKVEAEGALRKESVDNTRKALGKIISS